MNIKYNKNKNTKKVQPSPYIIKKDNGQIEFISWSKKNHIQYTDIAKRAVEENKRIKLEYKNSIKALLQKCGYDPKKHYTRKEKKRFSSFIKKNLYTNHTSNLIKNLDKEKHKGKQCCGLKRISIKTDKSKTISIEKEKVPVALVVDMYCKDNPERTYEFYTTYSTISYKEERENEAAKLANKYKNNDKFAGITVKNMQTNECSYFTKDFFKIAA